MRANVGIPRDELNMLLLRLVRQAGAPQLAVTIRQGQNLVGLGVIKNDTVQWGEVRSLLADMGEVDPCSA